MGYQATKEYLMVLYDRYRGSTKSEKKRLLCEAVFFTKRSRKHLIRVLNPTFRGLSGQVLALCQSDEELTVSSKGYCQKFKDLLLNFAERIGKSLHGHATALGDQEMACAWVKYSKYLLRSRIC